MTEHTTHKKIETMTKECLYTAPLLLMEKKPYEDITITEIAKKAGVSRMSYYRLYKSKDDILEQYADEVFRNLLNRIREMQNPDKKWLAEELFRICGENHLLLKNVYHARLYDRIMKNLIQYCGYLAEHVFGMEQSPETEYWIYGEAGKFGMLILCWMENGMKESPGQMADLLLKNETPEL